MEEETDVNVSAQITLRDYQQECVETVNALKDGSHLVQMATGLGKTVTFSRLARHGRMLILSHRDELVYQPVKYFDVPVGIEKGQVRSDGEEVISTSVQTLSRRLDMFKPGEFDIVVTDEAHHALAPTYRSIYEHLQPRLHVGFTATPRRGDDRGLGAVFDDIVFSRDLKWGISNGYLCDIDCRRVMVDWSTKGIKSSMGDFNITDLDRSVNNPTSNEQVAAAYEELHVGQTLIFATSVDHGKAISELIPGSVVVTGKTPLSERRKILQAFAAREIECLINYGVFTEGTDIPLIETVLLARPTKNPALYTQMVGRGLRLYTDKETGYVKTNLRLIDCMGASDNLSLCTPATLIGLNEADFPESAQRLGGSLMDLEKKVREQEDTPQGWILRARKVDVLADDDSLLWTTLYDGSKLLSGKKWSVALSAPDVLDHYTVTFKSSKGVSTEKYKSFSEAESSVIAWLLSNSDASKEKQLWKPSAVRSWGAKPASDKQKDYVYKLVGNQIPPIEIGALTKREASIVIDNALERRKAKASDGMDGCRCPICNQPLKKTRSGNISCASNKWKKDKWGNVSMASGCGFFMFASNYDYQLTSEHLRSLYQTGHFFIGNQEYILSGNEVVRGSLL